MEKKAKLCCMDNLKLISIYKMMIMEKEAKGAKNVSYKNLNLNIVNTV